VSWKNREAFQIL